MKSELRRFLRGFRYAASGVWAALRAERNLRFHLCAAVYVLLFSRFYSFSRAEYALLFLCIGGVMSLELMNSAVERAVDRPDASHWAAAGLAKDMAAGAVLVFSIAAAAVSGPEHLDKFACRFGGGGAAVEQLYEPAAYDDTRGV